MIHLPFIIDEPHEILYAGVIIGLAGLSWSFWRQREIERRKKEFTLRASHELRTPLTVIKATVEVLHDPKLSGLPSKKRRELINSLVRAIGKLEKIVEKLSNESRFTLKS